MNEHIPGDVAWLDGEFVPTAEATVPITAHVVNYGTGCFEGIRAYWNDDEEQLYVLLLREHVARLLRSCRILNLGLDAAEKQLSALLVELLERNGYRQDAYIRPMVFKSGSTIKVALSGITTSLAAYTIPMGSYLDIGKGLSLTFSAWRRIEDNAIPSRAKVIGSYVNAALASDEAREKGFDEALLLTSDGHVAEASSSNVFLVVGGELLTPEPSDDILVGITRGAVIELAHTAGITVRERRIDRSELLGADELFLCGTGVQVAPATSVDGRSIGTGKPGPVTLLLQEQYLAAARGNDPRFSAWCTPVYPHGS
jgi:branched-chain amino acid aminotransferase